MWWARDCRGAGQGMRCQVCIHIPPLPFVRCLHGLCTEKSVSEAVAGIRRCVASVVLPRNNQLHILTLALPSLSTPPTTPPHPT
jgi:hypothetical protein